VTRTAAFALPSPLVRTGSPLRFFDLPAEA